MAQCGAMVERRSVGEERDSAEWDGFAFVREVSS